MDRFKCMLAKKFEDKRAKFPMLISPKLDGIRAQFYKGEFFTRNKLTVKGMSHLIDALAPLAKQGLWLDGELMVPGKSFQESSGLIRRHSETPNAEFFVFDAPYLGGTQRQRLEQLEDLFIDFNLTSPIHLVPHVTIHSMDDIYRLYADYRSNGYEGAMVKTIHGTYVNSRSPSWLKIKEVETYDVVCIGFFEGQKALEGTLGGIIVELDGVEIRVGGGFTLAERRDIWDRQEHYLGKVAEIAGQELTPSGSLRHPRLVTWREDIC